MHHKYDYWKLKTKLRELHEQTSSSNSWGQKGHDGKNSREFARVYKCHGHGVNNSMVSHFGFWSGACPAIANAWSRNREMKFDIFKLRLNYKSFHELSTVHNRLPSTLKCSKNYHEISWKKRKKLMSVNG